MDRKSEPPAAENMETSPSQPDCSKDTSVNRTEEEQSDVSSHAADTRTLMCPHCEKHLAEFTAKMAEDEEKWQKILEELKRSEIKDYVPRAEELKKKSLHSVLALFADVVTSSPSKTPRADQDNQAADNTETSQPDSPEDEDKPDDMDPKSDPPAAANMETSPSQPDCSKETSVNREEEEGQAADSDSLSHPHSKRQFPVDTAAAAMIQQNEMAEDKEKCLNIQREQKKSEIKDCVPCAEEVMKTILSLYSDVLALFADVVTSLPSKTPRAATWFPKVIYSCVVTGETVGAHRTIQEKVEKRSWTSTTRVERTESVQECDIIIVFCPITSRIGSDVEAVTKHASVSSNNKPVIVVLMHHTRDKEYSPGVRKWFEDPRFVLEVHVLFHETQSGLLQCAQNDQAVREIQGELYRHSK